ncbi:MAG TPA: SH3 domain-containing protein [Candidatus Sulfotelmatobacter sp.]|nr:SH3 domain-containing protein [Candidatus Sulfotelmatobacter sp.]
MGRIETLLSNTAMPVEKSGFSIQTISPRGALGFSRRFGRPLFAILGVVIAVGLAGWRSSLAAREKDATQYGMGLIVNLPFPEAEVSQVVQEIVQNGIIRGTKEYNKDEFVSGAEVATSTRVFPPWTESGKVFYKVRRNALDPRNFKNGGDVGTLAVRYVVQAQDEKHTVLRIDAIFVEDFRHVTHASNGSVEGAEYKDIHDHLDSIGLMKTEAAEAEKAKQESSSKKQQVAFEDATAEPSIEPSPSPKVSQPPLTQPQSELNPSVSVEQRVHTLKQQVERIVKAPGAPLKSAPFHSASTLQALPSGAEVLIVITTPYWLGVETHDGQHGWVQRDELEMLP